MDKITKEVLQKLIADLRRCARQNDADAKPYDPWDPEYVGAKAVATEQRRMIKILTRVPGL